MDIIAFCRKFEAQFSWEKISRPTFFYGNRILRQLFDPCPDVKGLIAIKNQKLLNIAFSCLGEDECYLEIGTYLGKSLISTLVGNPPRQVYGCDNFSEFAGSFQDFQSNLRKYKFDDQVEFYNCDFREVFNKRKIPMPVGLYFYDGAHDEDSQYLAVKEVEPLLAAEAIVIIDDWRFAEDSRSYAKVGTERAMQESVHEWKILYELPARFNGDRAMWWNGVGVLSFRARKALGQRA